MLVLIVAFLIGTPWSFIGGVAGYIAIDRWDARHPREQHELPLIFFVLALITGGLAVAAAAGLLLVFAL